MSSLAAGRIALAVLAGVAAALVASAAPAPLPEPSPAEGLAASATAQMAQARRELMEDRARLAGRIDRQNARCTDVASDDADLVASCRSDQAAILRDLAGYRAALARYEAELKEARDAGAPASPGSGARPGIRIGAAARIEGEVYVQDAEGGRRRLTSGDAIASGDRIVTGPGGTLQTMLLDNTVFTLGPNSDMVMDEFVYDPRTDAGTIVAHVLKGAFRFVSGRVRHDDPDKVKIRLPSGAVGIRGTDIECDVGPDGSAEIKLFSGAVEYRPDNGAPFVRLRPGEMIGVDAGGRIGAVEPIR